MTKNAVNYTRDVDILSSRVYDARSNAIAYAQTLPDGLGAAFLRGIGIKPDLSYLGIWA